MQLLYNIIILFILVVALTDILAYLFLIKRAMNKFVKPKLQAKGQQYIGHKWLYFFGRGDFRKLKIKVVKPKTKRKFKSLYSFVYYQDNGITKRITVRIDILSYSIDQIIYSNEV